VENLCISHAHSDHVNSIFSIVGLRAKTKGTNDKPLTIYGPRDNYGFRHIEEYVRKVHPRLPYKLSFVPIEPGFELRLNGSHTLRAFPMEHQRNATTLGYKVVESRSRLKTQYRGQDIPALLKSGMDKVELNEVYHQNVMCYCLDAYRLNPADIANADVCVMDSTFLRREDRTDHTHASIDEVVSMAREAKVKRVLAAHLSVRYSLDHQRDVQESLKSLDFPVQLVSNQRVSTY
jgi:ribonuclease Z